MGKIGPKMGVYFDAPDGLDLKGDKGTASIRWMRGDDGRYCITSINGVTMGDAPPMKDNEGAEPAPGDNEGDEGEMA